MSDNLIPKLEDMPTEVLEAVPCMSEQKLDAIAAIAANPDAVMDLWWSACGDGWAVPDDLPAKFLRLVLQEAENGGQRLVYARCDHCDPQECVGGSALGNWHTYPCPECQVPEEEKEERKK